jgi:putative oxygen-independent coproporphyrinogen III oxidase
LNKKGFFLVKFMRNFGLYLHWPFCLSKCPYCDFNSYVAGALQEERWEKALLKEMKALSEMMEEEGGLSTIFFGGGTPSLMSPRLVGRLIEGAQGFWPVTESELEITLEANPQTVDLKNFEGFRRAGVNRLSLGVQSFCDEELRFLGRIHSSDQAVKAILEAQAIFSRFSIDLIYALPRQTQERWQQTLEQVMTFEPRHLSCYQLTFEPQTPFYKRFDRGELAYPPEELALDFYTQTERFLKKQGLLAYEVSNYAAPGEESRHNLIYWRGQDFVGVGPGAHGRFHVKGGGRVAQDNTRTPAAWLRAVEAGESSTLTPLSAKDTFEEWLLMGLRLREGIRMEEAFLRTGKPWDEWVNPDKLERLEQEGLVEMAPEMLKVTRAGRLVLNALVRELFFCGEYFN